MASSKLLAMKAQLSYKLRASLHILLLLAHDEKLCHHNSDLQTTRLHFLLNNSDSIFLEEAWKITSQYKIYFV